MGSNLNPLGRSSNLGDFLGRAKPYFETLIYITNKSPPEAGRHPSGILRVIFGLENINNKEFALHQVTGG